MKTIAKILSLSLPMAFGVVPVLAGSTDVGNIASQLQQATVNLEAGNAAAAMLHMENAKQYLILHEAKFPAHFVGEDSTESVRRAQVSQIVQVMKTAAGEIKAGRKAQAIVALEKTDRLLLDYI